MCQIPKVLIVAPAERHLELRKALSSLEYDIAATVTSIAEAADVTANVIILLEPTAADIAAAGALKTVAIGGEATDADMLLDPDDIASFKTRVWELFRPR